MRFINLFLILFVITGFSINCNSQISYGGTPPSFKTKSINNKFDIREFAKLDMVKVKAQDDSDDIKGAMYKVGRSIPVNLNMDNSGTWTALPDGINIWRLTIKSADAKAIAVYYDKFYLPVGSQLFLYNKAKTQVIGAFSHLSNPESGYFSTELIQGDEVTLEYVSSTKSLIKPEINISEISYVYRGVDHLFARLEKLTGWTQSGLCEVNVNCSEGANWQNQKRGVAEIFLTTPIGQGWCSGSLMNNTANDCDPYFLTAFHCWESSTTAQMHQWQFYFNYEASGCSTPGIEPSYNTMIGCTFIADGDIQGGSDFLLVHLDIPVPSSYNLYFNGWDANTTASSSGVCIHHPYGDIKKISTYTSALTTFTYPGSATNSDWRVVWATPTANGSSITEPGSDGAPIFNISGLCIGTILGGSSTCNNLTLPDFCGKMSYHWMSNGTSNNLRLKPWLDPNNTGSLTCVGLNTCPTSTLTAGFIGDTLMICTGQTVIFSDNSTGAPTSWTWTFSGGAPSTFSGQIPPPITYNTPGIWDVKLKVSNSSVSDSLTIFNYITVTTCPNADFIGSPTILSAGQTVNFTDLSTGAPTSWNWTFNGGTPGTYSGQTPPAIVYYTPGIFNVLLAVSNSMTNDTEVKNAYITVNPILNIDKNSIDYINIYPNPTEKYLFIENAENPQINIYDIIGLDVDNKIQIKTKNNNFTAIDISNLPKGIYLLVVQFNNQTVRRKIIKE